MRIVFFLLLSVVCMSCNNTHESIDLDYSNHSAQLVISNQRLRLGKVNRQKEKSIKCTFMLKNDGNEDIIIEKIDVSCGCISIEKYPHSIAPKKMEVLIAMLNTTNQRGFLNKSICIKSNATNSMELIRIKGEIID